MTDSDSVKKNAQETNGYDTTSIIRPSRFKIAYLGCLALHKKVTRSMLKWVLVEIKLSKKDQLGYMSIQGASMKLHSQTDTSNVILSHNVHGIFEFSCCQTDPRCFFYLHQDSPQSPVTMFAFSSNQPLNQMINSAAVGAELVKLEGETCSAVKQKNHVALQYRQITKPGEDHFYYPCVNPLVKGSKYRYYYGTGCGESDFIPNSIARFDLETGEVKRWDGGSDDRPFEPVFIANSEISDQNEDEGVLVATVIDYSEKKEDRLVFIDAKDMTEIASASLLGITKPDGSPCFIPEADHGIFINEQHGMVGVAL